MASPDEIMRALSEVVRSRRQQLGFSQEQLSSKADLHRTYISDIEAGKRNLSIKSLHRLAVALNSSMSELVKSAEQQSLAAAASASTAKATVASTPSHE
jgi:transcriptional regulator with XRE-family HTH domain